MKVIVKEVGKMPEVKEIKNELSELQKIVGGYVEYVMALDGIIILCNEDGKTQGLPPNFSTNNDVIVGTVIFTTSQDGEFTDLNDWQIEYLMGQFYN